MIKKYLIIAVAFFSIMPVVAQAWGDRIKEKTAGIPQVSNDLAYGSDPLQKLDVYMPRSQQSLIPVLIFVHGGGWQRGDKSMAKKHGRFYAAKGVVLVSVNYRLGPQDVHPAQAVDVASAIKWVYDHIAEYGGDTRRLYLAGHSAGAHLVALVGTDTQYLATHHLSPTLFQAIFPNDTGSFDFNDPIEKGKRFVQPKIDETFGTNPDALAKASPVTYARSNKNLPRFVTFVTAERPDAVRQTKVFHEALKKSGGKSAMYIVENNGHRDMNLAMSDSNSLVSRIMLDVINQKI
jgi:arylformamidase